MNWKFVAIIVIFVILLALPVIFHFQSRKTEKERAIEICIRACREAAISGRDLSVGLCLLDPVPDLRDWVCYVAHWPRQDIDNLPENQCSSFRERKARHFVEVDPSCKFIRAY
jgi:hypothetical protein